MAKFNKTFADFSNGILSRKMAGRIDTENYYRGLNDSMNMLGMPQGGVIKRPGSRYLLNMRTIDVAVPVATDVQNFNGGVIIPFYRTDGETFLIVVNLTKAGTSTQKISIFKTDGTQFYPAILSDMDTSYTSNYKLWYVQTGNIIIIGDTQGLGRPFCVRWRANSFGGTSFEVFDYFISYDTYILAHYHSMPFLPRNITTVTLAPAATSGTGVNLVASANFFIAAHVGARFRIVHSTTEGVCIVTAVTNATTAVVTIEEAFGANSASTNWAESAFSDVQGWPRSACMFEQRLFFGGTYNKPDSLWGSITGNIFHMNQERLIQNKSTSDVAGDGYYGAAALSTDPLYLPIAANRANLIRWIAAKDVLVVGTTEEEYVVSGGDAALSALSLPLVKQQTAIGAIAHQPISMNDSILYINRNGKEVYNFKYNDTNGSFVSNSLNIMNDEISEYAATTASKSRAYIAKIVWQESRNTIWALTSDGDLLSCIISPDARQAGWFKHFIDDDANNYGYINDICVISANGTDTLFLVKRRNIDSQARDYIEYIGDDYKNTSLYLLSATYLTDVPCFLDCAKVQTAPLNTTLTGLSHLKGQVISVVADGTELTGTFTVSAAGEVTLPAVYDGYVVAGYKYASYFQTMDVEVGKDLEDAVGTLKRMDRAYVKFWQTREANIGSSATDIIPASFAVTEVLYSGDKKELMNHTPDEASKVYISQSYAYPLCVLSMTIRGVTYD